MLAAVSTAVVLGVGASAASAAYNFSDCPVSNPAVTTCVDFESSSGHLNIKGFDVPLGDSISIRGGLVPGGGALTFVPPTGTSGFFTKPVSVPGGLLGLDLPLSFNTVTATAKLAGNGPIVFNPNTVAASLPIKLELDNPLLASNCAIGTDSHPVQLNLITGTTSPPPPNTPISGHIGTRTAPNGVLTVTDNLNVDNSFAVPGAWGCGGLGLLDLAIDLKLKLPSAAGNNTIEAVNTLYVVSAARVRAGTV